MPRRTHKPAREQSRKKAKRKRKSARPGEYNRRLNQRLA